MTKDRLIGAQWFTDFGKPSPGLTHMLCLAGAGAFATEFYQWPQALRGHADVAAVLLPGRERRIREPGIRVMSDLVDALVASIRPWLGQPLALFGHSFGALVMFELARRLHREEAGGNLRHLFVSGQLAPRIRQQVPSSSSTDQELIAYIRSFNGAPEDVLANRAFMQSYFPGMRADLALYESYQFLPGELVDCPVTAYFGTNDDSVSAEDVRTWQEVATGPLASVGIPGGHLFMRTHISDLVSDIASRLEADAHAR
jgi:medium-chain acyl-[acyl-carrier-protein] hydrolase